MLSELDSPNVTPVGHGPGHSPPLSAKSAADVAVWPSVADMIDSAAFLVRSSAVGQRWA